MQLFERIFGRDDGPPRDDVIDWADAAAKSIASKLALVTESSGGRESLLKHSLDWVKQDIEFLWEDIVKAIDEGGLTLRRMHWLFDVLAIRFAARGIPKAIWRPLLDEMRQAARREIKTRAMYP